MIGNTKKKYLFVAKGTLNEGRAFVFAREIIEAAGMTPARQGRIDPYPYLGHGGIGWTGYFPLVESYLMIDVYADYDYTEILLSTCKPERVRVSSLEELIADRIGPIVHMETIESFGCANV